MLVVDDPVEMLSFVAAGVAEAGFAASRCRFVRGSGHQLLTLPALGSAGRARRVLRSAVTAGGAHGGRRTRASAANGATRIGVTAREILEVKRTLDGKTVVYPAVPLLVERGVRAVLLCRMDEPEVVAGARMTLQPGTLSVGYFWCDRPYNVYHWLYEGETLVHYINLGRFVALNEEALIWDDYAVDILAYPDGSSETLDEDEIPPAVDAATRRFIAEATAAVLANVKAIVAAANAETRELLAAEVDVVRR